MKIATRPVINHTNIPASQTQAFRINFDATMAYALMSGIAKDKISYPIREISTNAYDANPTVPFDVQLPTRMDPQFKVRDYGQGLSHAQILDVYTTFGGSLKRDDDSQVGGLGYGSKSPFAYLISKTEGGASFQVTSIHRPHPDPNSKPIKTIYLMALDDTGMPTVTTLSSIPTTEPTGIEVSFAVDNSDISEFHSSAKHIYTFFPVKPNIRPNNLIDPSLSQPIESNPTHRWSLYNTTNFYGPHVRMGCVAYPIDFSNLPSPYDEYRWPFRNSPILFEAPIGSLSFTTSREDLGYDARTIRTIVSLLEKFEDDYAQKPQVKIDQATTYFEACGIFVELRNSHPQVNYLAQGQKLTYKGKRLTDEYSFVLGRMKLQLVTVSELQYLDKFTTSGLPLNTKRSKINSTTKCSIPALSLKDVKTVVYSSKPKKPFQVHRLKHHFSKPENTEPFIWLKLGEFEPELEQTLKACNFDDLKLVDIETLPLPPIDRTPTSTPTTPATGLKRSKTCKWTLYLDDSDPKPQKALLDYEDTSLQVFVLTHSSAYQRRQFRNRYYTVQSGRPHGLSYTSICNLRSLLQEHAPSLAQPLSLEHVWVFDADSDDPRPPNAIMLGDYFVQTVEPLIDPLTLETIQTASTLPSHSWRKYANLLPGLDPSLVPSLDPSIAPQEFLDLCRKVQENLSSDKHMPWPTKNLYDTYARLKPSIRSNESSVEDLLNAELAQLFKKYPLLELIIDRCSSYVIEQADIDRFHHYFSLVNAATRPDP